MNSFYTEEELKALGLGSFGKNVLISKKASIYSPGRIRLGDHVRIDDFCILSGSITMGSYVHISAYTGLWGGEHGIEIRDFSGISSRCAVYAMSDDYSGQTMANAMIPEELRGVWGGKVTLERHVIVGSGCTVVPGVTLEEGAAVGSMSLVNRSLPGWGIYAGIPCKKIKDRSRKLLELEAEYLNNLERKQ